MTKAAAPPAAAVELYGFAATAGRVNITTLTDTALTRALAASPADVFATFDAARATAINTALPAAISYVQAQFTATGLGTVPSNLMTTPFIIGDGIDKLLDNMAVAFLGAGKTYADWIALVKRAADLIVVTAPLPVTIGEITVAPAILALPVTGKLTPLKSATDTAGFAGSHVFGRGVRSKPQTAADPNPTYTVLSDCKFSIEGSDFVLSAGGQSIRVAVAPLVSVVAGVSYYGSYASVSPRTLYGDKVFLYMPGPYNAAFQYNLMGVSIANGVVTDVTASDGGTGLQITCGSLVGSNLNTDRSRDILNLPAAWQAGALPGQAGVITASDLTGFSANVNFGRGVYSTYNADLTVKDVTSISDCKLEVKDGILRLSSVQAAFDRSFILNRVFAASPTGVSRGVLQFNGNVSASALSTPVRVMLDLSTVTPFALSVDSLDFSGSKQSLICPAG